MVTGGNKWPLSDVGILGLSPQGDFSNYLRANYESNTSFVFGYEPKSLKDTQLSFDLYTIVNPKFASEDIMYEIALPKE